MLCRLERLAKGKREAETGWSAGAALIASFLVRGSWRWWWELLLLASLTWYCCDEWHPCLAAYTWPHASALSGTTTSFATYTEEDELSTRKEFAGGGARLGHPGSQLLAAEFYLDALKFNWTMPGLDPSCSAPEPASSQRSWPPRQ